MLHHSRYRRVRHLQLSYIEYFLYVVYVGIGIFLLYGSDYRNLVGTGSFYGYGGRTGYRYVRFRLGVIHPVQCLRHLPEYAAKYAEIRRMVEFSEGRIGLLGVGIGFEVPFRSGLSVWLAFTRP